MVSNLLFQALGFLSSATYVLCLPLETVSPNGSENMRLFSHPKKNRFSGIAFVNLLQFRFFVLNHSFNKLSGYTCWTYSWPHMSIRMINSDFKVGDVAERVAEKESLLVSVDRLQQSLQEQSDLRGKDESRSNPAFISSRQLIGAFDDLFQLVFFSG